MFIPYHTDAPVYHYPVATIGLIVANVLAFFLVVGDADPETINWGVLEHGTINPAQWITSNFLHADLGHLLGNMLYLWIFGLVVEGKLGWYRFLPIYLGIGISECAIEQVLMLGASEGSSQGASAIIFGMMAMALIWAPKNDIHCFVLIFLRPFFFSLSIVVMSISYVVLQIVIVGITNFEFSGAMAHLFGFALGLPIAIMMLKLGWVDCEGWDLFRVMKGEHIPGLPSEQRVDLPNRGAKHAAEIEQKTPANEDAMREEQEQLAQEREEEALLALRLLKSYLDSGEAKAALVVYQKQAGADGSGWQLPEKELVALVTLLHKAELWSESIPPLLQLIRLAPARSTAARLRLAQILLQAEQRPKQSLAVLAKVEVDQMNTQQRSSLEKLRQLAQQQIEEGHLELDLKDW